MNGFSNDDTNVLSEKYDWMLPRAFKDKRHQEKIEGGELTAQTWRMKERMKTVSVALVMCLNVGVDPPGIVKTQPCARLECWIDPLSLSPQKALETIGGALQKQYERWQPRARYKQSLDPTAEEVKKLCTSLRRNAKDERVLFHYNGHGVPQPTTNGEIWVFNRNFTQYIPLSIYDLQTWMGSPSIYVFDCSNAGLILKSFHLFAEQHEREYEEMLARSAALSACPPPNYSGCIQLGACEANQILPMNSDLPADLFTACLTTPIRVALRWFFLQNKNRLLPQVTLEMMEKIPGQLPDRRTMLGELNWIFTAITDTIAWNTLPRNLFQKLFRQDLLVASLFRNFLLAERIMRSYDCTPVSSPKLPTTAQHSMWAAWDLALDLCITQLPKVLEEIAQIPPAKDPAANNNANTAESIVTNHMPSPFFEEQLTAFQVWLNMGNENRHPPEQLPIVLQVLLSQVHRVRALELLGRFLDLGSWAVNLALSVGIFPYVLKLLQSSARELRPLLVFIWAKILAVDHSCQNELVRDSSHKYFIAMVGDISLPYEHRTMAVFVLTNIVRNYRPGQQAALTANCISSCLEALDESDTELRRWVCICLGLIWYEFSSARWCGVRDSAHEKMYSLLDDKDAEVRAAAVFALGTFINSGSERTEHANAVDHSVAMTIVTKMCGNEASPLVRQEMVVALHNFVLVFENNFVVLEQQHIREQEAAASTSPINSGSMRRISSQAKMKILAHGNALATVTGAESHHANADSIRRAASSSSLSSLFSAGPLSSSSAASSIYGKVWAWMATFEKDPYPGVALLARTVTDYIRKKAREAITSGANLRLSTGGGSNTSRLSTSSSLSHSPDPHAGGDAARAREIVPLIGTKYIEWCWDQFARPCVPSQGSNLMGFPCKSSVPSDDPQDPVNHAREWRYLRNSGIRKMCMKRARIQPGKIDEQIFNSKNLHTHGSSPSSTSSSPSFSLSSHASPFIVKLHDYEHILVSSEISSVSLYDYGESARLLAKWDNSGEHRARITSLEWVNVHDERLVLVGCDDGTVRFWRLDFEKPKLVSSWNALSDLGLLNKSSKSSGLLTKWNPETQAVLATGDAKIVRVWDVTTETKKGDWFTGYDESVACIDMHQCEPSLAVVGVQGAVRLIDFRLPPSECGVVTWREFGDSWVVSASVRHDKSVIAGSANGRVRFFDLRSRSGVKTIETASDITALGIHPQLPYLASGSLNHSVNVYGFRGTDIYATNVIRESLFASGRMGSVSSLHFHPYKPMLAAADSCSIYVYKSKQVVL